MSTERERAPRLPPRWFIRAAWVVHRGMYRASGGRFGLCRARSDRWGMLALTTVVRRTGQTHRVIVGYLEDGSNIITMAMNGWAKANPAWWLNLQASPETRVDLADGPRDIRARTAEGEERARLWAVWQELDRTSMPTPNVARPRRGRASDSDEVR